MAWMEAALKMTVGGKSASMETVSAEGCMEGSDARMTVCVEISSSGKVDSQRGEKHCTK